MITQGYLSKLKQNTKNLKMIPQSTLFPDTSLYAQGCQAFPGSCDCRLR